MSQPIDGRKLTRRALLLGSAGAATVWGLNSASAKSDKALVDASLIAGTTNRALHLAATDGWVSIADPASTPPFAPFWPDPYAATHNPLGLLNL